MTERQLLLAAFMALAGIIATAIADDDIDCSRYRMAGLPCPPKPASPRAADAARGPVRAPVLPRALDATVPATVAGQLRERDASGAPVPGPAPGRSLSAPTLPPLQLGAAVKSLPALSVGNVLAPLATTPPAAIPVPPNESREPGQIVVYWASVEEADTALARLARDRLVLPMVSSTLGFLGGVLAVFELPTAAEAASFREQLIRDFPGVAVDFNTRYRPLQQSTAKPRIYLPQKIEQPGNGSAMPDMRVIRIGIVDGPVAPIAALAGVNVIRKNFLAAADTEASAGHATAIAALISGQDRTSGFAGIAPQARLYSAEIMRTVGQHDCTNSAALVRAMDWLLSEKVQLINLSLGGPGDMVMEKAFARLAEFPVAIVAAAGNGGPAAPAAYPAAYPGVIAVTATDAVDNPYVAANRGGYITLAAPGVDLWVPDAASGHYVSGTSFSAAVVTAVGALLLGKIPQLNAKSLARHLCRGARDLGAPGPDPVFGCGLIQVGTSLRDERS